MELLRDFLRDLIGIIFPGCLIIIFITWFFASFIYLFFPIDFSSFMVLGQNLYFYIVLLIFSYIAGLSLRIKRLDDLEEVCTNEYRKREKPDLDETAFNEAVEKLKQTEIQYYDGALQKGDLVKAYREYMSRFGFWESFPYRYLVKGRRLIQQSEDYNKFFEKYEKEGITEFKSFFNMCKAVIYEYSTSLKEELIRQEALVRLFAGIYYAIKYGLPINIFIGLAHFIKFTYFILSDFSKESYYTNANSLIIFLVSFMILIIFLYLNREIKRLLRVMRGKEVTMTYDAIYIISQKYDLQYLFNTK